MLLSVFISIETRTRQPITPLHMFRDRNRAGSYAIMLGLAAALFGMFFFLTLFVQEVLGYSPLRTGLAFLPVSAVIIVAAQVVFGLGMGFLFVPLTLTAVSGVSRRESGAASSLLNAMQQVGGSLGLSILVTVFGTASRNEATEQVGGFLSTATPALRAQFRRTGQLPQPVAHQVLSHGISVAFEFAVLFALVALVVSVVVIRTPSQPAGGLTRPTAGTAAGAG